MTNYLEVYTHKFVVTSKVYNGFLTAFQDRNPIHVDVEQAKALGFPSVVMHGNILNGFLSYFVGECLPNKKVMIISQQIDFHKPVFLEDELTLTAKIDQISSAVQMISFKFVFRNQQNKKVAKGVISIKEI